MTTITTGTRVAFKREFLRNTGQFTGWAPFARGEVIENHPLSRGVPGLVTVRWDDRTHIAGERGPSQSLVLINNLVREDRIHLEAV